MTPAHPTGYAAARSAIEAHGCAAVTSDVFDTLVWRPVAVPAHLWPVLGGHLRENGLLPGHVDPTQFTDARIRAESRARAATGVTDRAPEVTLDEIWRQMPVTWTGGAIDRYVEAELLIEGRTLRPHRPAIELLQLARSRSRRVVLVSDTYLSAAQLRDVLAAAGVPDDAYDDVVVSSEHRRSKADGLLDVAVRQLGVQRDRIVHLGDHEISDIDAAVRAGLVPVQLDVPAALDSVAGAHAPLRRYSADRATDGGRSGAVRETLNLAGAHGLDPSYQFGAAVAGPLMAGFAAWASVTTEELGGAAVHCLLREGGTIAELIRRVRPGGAPPVEVHASRWAILRAAVFTGSVDELYGALARRADFRAEHVADAFGVPLALVQKVVGDTPHDHRARAGAVERIAAHPELREQIVASSARLRGGVERYLERTLHLGGEGPVVLCDIGWSGMIQQGITDIAHGMGIDRDVVGLYSAITTVGQERASQGARMLAYLPSVGAAGRAAAASAVIIRNPEILERIMTPPVGTLLEFTTEGEPVCMEGTEPRTESLDLAQQGLLDVATCLAASISADLATWTADAEFRIALAESVAAVLQSPDGRVAEPLGGWHHDDVAGTASETLAVHWVDRLLPFANAYDLALVPMTDAFWLPGVAAVASERLAGQMLAVQQGASADLLCPPTPLGEALVTAFSKGSLRAVASWKDTPRTNPDGWSLVIFRCSVPSLRAFTAHVADRGGIVEFGLIQLELTTDDGVHTEVIESFDHPCVQLVLGRRLGTRTAGFAEGGHLVVSAPAGTGGTVHAARISIAYRGLLIDDVDRRLVEPSRLVAVPRRLLWRAKDALRGPAKVVLGWVAKARARSHS